MEDAPRDLEHQLIDILRAAEGPADPSQKKRGGPARQPERPQERPLLPPPPRRPEGGPPTRPRDRAAPKGDPRPAQAPHQPPPAPRRLGLHHAAIRPPPLRHSAVRAGQRRPPLMTKPGGCFAPAQNLAQKMRIWYESPSYERIPKTTSPPTAGAAREN